LAHFTHFDLFSPYFHPFFTNFHKIYPYFCPIFTNLPLFRPILSLVISNPAVFIAQIQAGHPDKTPLTLVWALFAVLWGTVFLESWRRAEKALAWVAVAFLTF
jgi:hypothetical protein